MVVPNKPIVFYLRNLFLLLGNKVSLVLKCGAMTHRKTRHVPIAWTESECVRHEKVDTEKFLVTGGYCDAHGGGAGFAQV